eukprot:2736481-Rhodomonas_salina.1
MNGMSNRIPLNAHNAVACCISSSSLVRFGSMPSRAKLSTRSTRVGPSAPGMSPNRATTVMLCFDASRPVVSISNASIYARGCTVQHAIGVL